MRFKRPHHQRIARVLWALDGDRLRGYQCLFGGGTAIALQRGEYRESVDMDFMVSDKATYRQLRSLCREAGSVAPLMHADRVELLGFGDLRADQYGIRTRVYVDERPIKFEIVLEARVQFAAIDEALFVEGVSALNVIDAATSKLMANSDRGHDAGVHYRDLLDLAMLAPSEQQLAAALKKAEAAYGSTVRRDVLSVYDALRNNLSLLPRALEAMSVTLPEALVWQKISELVKRIQSI